MSDLTYCSDVYIDGRSLNQMAKVIDSLTTYAVTKSQEDKPLGRDRLGRLMYPGDYVWPHKPDDPYWIPVWREADGRVAFDEGLGLAEHITLPEFVTIDLAASPKRANYERYFADLGTLDEIIDALRSDNSFAVFDFQLYVSSFGSGTSWVDWLQQEATV